MPRRSILSAAERESLLALPDTKDELIRHYTFSESDLSIIRQRRGSANRLGFAVQLCYLRFPGVILGADEPPFPPLLRLVANQLKVGIESWDEYGQREQTRREHLVELQTVFGFQPFTIGHYRQAVQLLTELAMQTDKGIVLARALIEHLRRQSVIVPALNAVERASAEAITRANRRLYDALAEPLTDVHRRRLDDLLKRRDNGKTTWLAWLRQSPVKPNSRHMLEHIERLKAWQALDLPSGIERSVHQNRLLKIAREGGQMTPADLAKFEPQRRYATLVALAIEGMATVTDEIIDLHDRILGKLFNAAKNKHQQQFQASGKAINAKVRLFGRIGQALACGHARVPWALNPAPPGALSARARNLPKCLARVDVMPAFPVGGVASESTLAANHRCGNPDVQVHGPTAMHQARSASARAPVAPVPRARHSSNALRITRRDAARVMTRVSIAASPMTPPMPLYRPSVFSRTKIMSTWPGSQAWRNRPDRPWRTPGRSLIGRTLAYRLSLMRLPITGDQPAILPSFIVAGWPSGPFQPTAPSRITSAARHRSSLPAGQSRSPCSTK